MPFENERAAYAPLRRIMQSEKVKRLHDRFRYAEAEKTGGDDFPVSEIESLGGSVRQPDLILAVDGSYLSAEVKTGYPRSGDRIYYCCRSADSSRQTAQNLRRRDYQSGGISGNAQALFDRYGPAGAWRGY